VGCAAAAAVAPGRVPVAGTVPPRQQVSRLSLTWAAAACLRVYRTPSACPWSAYASSARRTHSRCRARTCSSSARAQCPCVLSMSAPPCGTSSLVGTCKSRCKMIK
jgi:hypothetical protein